MGKEGAGGFWSSLPGVLTGLAALMTAAGGIYALAREQADAEPAAAGATGNIAAAAEAPAPTDGTKAPTEEAVAPLPPDADESAETRAGPPACLAGYVWREARPGDKVCVTVKTRDETAAENEAAASRRVPPGTAENPNTCISGFVWREAYEGDPVCVEPASRERAHRDNAAAAERVAGS